MDTFDMIVGAVIVLVTLGLIAGILIGNHQQIEAINSCIVATKQVAECSLAFK